jgi:hypothetical protein
MLLLLALAACGRSPAKQPDSPAAQTGTSASAQANTPQNAAMSLSPASGYGGLYVQVSGENWPQNMLVLVTLEDEQGRSETLAAIDTDQAGSLATGFLFPIDQRWLSSDSLWVVTTTADGRVESKASFTIVEPGTEIASSSTSTSTGSTSTGSTAQNGASTAATGETLTGTVAVLTEAGAHTVVLPLIASTGPERRESARTARNRSSRESSSSRESASGATQVDIEIVAGNSKTIDCRNGNEWITVAIYSGGGFDATRIDPGSVTVADASDLGYGGNSEIVLAAWKGSSKPEPATRSRQAYQWRWHLEDVDGDGSTDMVMEFRLDYTELKCNAAVVAVTGRTKDGGRFEGTNRVDMLVLERS